MPIRSFQGKMPNIAATAYVDESAVVIGDVTIGQDSSLWPMVVARGDVNRIIIGRGTNVQDGSVLHATHDGEYSPGGYTLTVGDHVTVGHRSILHACAIGDYCLIGMGSTIMDGAALEARVMLGANSLVPGGRRLEGGYLYVGAPVRRVRQLTERELAYLEYSAAHYVRMKNRHMAR